MRHLCENGTQAEHESQRLVLGNPALSVGELWSEFCQYTGRKPMPLISLNTQLANLLIKVFRIKLSPWDRYCMNNPDQSYKLSYNPKSFGLEGYAPSLTDGLADIGIPHRS